jgi:hypothetical protein
LFVQWEGKRSIYNLSFAKESGKQASGDEGFALIGTSSFFSRFSVTNIWDDTRFQTVCPASVRQLEV